MPDRAEFTSTYRTVIALLKPAVRGWGRLQVCGLEELPREGPVLLAGNHDSYWDPLAVGVAAGDRRQIRALAKSGLWKIRGLDRVMDAMGQIPVDRGSGDTEAIAQAVKALRDGACIGIFPEGTRSLGRQLRARSGFGRLAYAVPEAQIVCCAVTGSVDMTRLKRPQLTVEFFRPRSGQRIDNERPVQMSQRLLDEIRTRAPHTIAGHRRRSAT